MKVILTIGFLSVLVGFFACGLQNKVAASDAPQIGTNSAEEDEPAKNNTAKNKPLVLVELYTSEGCPVCPPADRNLTFLETEQPFAQADLITLALHVDYWNSGGWRDEFSSAMFSRRQDIYRQVFRTGSIYTPQMIIDGQTQFPGTDLAKAQKSIIESAKNEKGKIELSTVKDAGGSIKLQAKISDLPKHDNSTIFLAIAEDNPVSSNSRGVNSAVKPVFTSVVRQLNSLGFLTAEQKSLDVETFLQFQTDWKTDNLKFVVFVQENGSRKVFAVGRLILTKEK